jgi:hypothetical protein
MKYLLASKDSKESAEATVATLKADGVNFTTEKDVTRYKIYANADRLMQDTLDRLRSQAGQSVLKAKNAAEETKNLKVGMPVSPTGTTTRPSTAPAALPKT